MTTNLMITCPLNHLREMLSQSHEIHSASIENICSHQPLSIVTHFVRIYDHIRVSSISQSFLLISSHTQYPIKVESSYNIVAR